jgi:uncharacterized repeat protein (TIGR03803 family)
MRSLRQSFCLRRLRHGLSTSRSIFALTILLVAASLPSAQAQTYTALHFFNQTDGSASTYPALLAQGRDGNLYGTTSGGGTTPYGTVFKMTPSGSITTLHTFNSTDGATPVSGLTLGTDGNFYGTTETGGTSNFGTIFKITPSGTLTTLYNFTGSTDGSYPVTPPVQGKSGAFYGTTYFGGTYSITSTGSFKALPGLVGGRSYGPLLLASDGNFYGTTADVNTVFRLTPTGAVTPIYAFDGTHGLNPYGGLVQGSDGLLYGTTTGGGTGGGGVVFKLSLAGAITVLHNFDSSSTTDGWEPTAGLVAASDGYFYGATAQGPANTNNYGGLFKISKSGAYSLLYLFDGTNGANPYATQLQHTNGIIYGLANSSSDTCGCGVFYSLNNSLKSFVALMTTSGKAGQTVEILGTGLSGTTGVKFGTVAATFTVVSNNYITAVVPSSGTTGFVTVTTPSGTLTSNKKFLITPVISSFAPTSGPVGTIVMITGTGFLGATQVTFGGVKATTFTVNSGTQITATVPTGALTGKISVKTPGGTAASTTSFTVQ